MKKDKIGYYEHVEIGMLLSDIQRTLVHLHVRIGNAYPIRSTTVRRVEKASIAVSDLRSELDRCVCRENPREEDAIRAYYPDGRILYR